MARAPQGVILGLTARAETWLVPGSAAVILVAAAAVRLFDLTRYGFNTDEAVYSGQAAALAGNAQYGAMFGVFRAHPLLVHFLVSLVYRVVGVNDIAPRVVTALAGLGLVIVIGLVGAIAYGRLAGVLAMAFAAVSPYAVTVSRQMLLDGPMAFFVGLMILFLALYVRKPARLTLYAAAVAAGLSFLSKESAILVLPAVVVFMLLASDVPFRIRDVLAAGAIYVLTIAPFPIALLLAGGGKSAQQFFVWQILRRSNHDPAFYLTRVAPSIGIPLLLLALIGLAIALRRRRGIDVLMVSLCLVTIGFFQLWPVKGFQYLIPVLTPVVILAANGLIWLAAAVATLAARIGQRRPHAWNWAAKSVMAAGCVATLGLGSASVIAAPAPTLLATDSSDDLLAPAYGFVAGTGGLKASRPVGLWVASHTLPSSRFLTIGPSFANIIEFYGQRRAFGLAVSPNALHRNPTYVPITNPDLMLKTNAIQYLVYDSYTASRTRFFTTKLLKLVKKYHGVEVYSDYEPVHYPSGATAVQPVVIIFEVHP